VTTPEGIGFWDLQQRKAADLPTITVEYPEAVAMSHDGGLVAVALPDPDSVRIYDLDGGVSPVVEEFPAPVAAIGFDPTEPRLWVGVETWPGDGQDNLWFLNYEQDGVESFSYSTHPVAFDIDPAGEWVSVPLVGGYGTTAPLVDGNEPQIMLDLASPSVFLPDGHTLMGATGDGGVGLWDLESARKIGTLPVGNCVEIACPLAIAPDGKTVLQVNGPDLVGFDTERVEWTYSTPEAWNDTGFDFFSSGAIVPESGDLIAVNSMGVHRWRTGDDGLAVDPASPELLSDLPGNVLAVSPDGSVVAIGSTEAPNVTVIDLARPEEPHILEMADYIADLTFDPSGSRLIVAVVAETVVGQSSRIEFWNTETWEREPIEPIDTGEYGSWDLCVGDDGRTLYFGNSDTVAAVDIESGERVADLGSGMYGLACRPDGTVVGQSYQLLWTWTASSGAGEILVEVPIDDSSTGTILELSPDGRYIATAGWDGGTWLWEAETGTLLRTFNGYGTGNDLAFSADGDTLVGFGAQIAVWDLSYLDDPNAAVCEQIDQGLTVDEWRTYLPDLDYGSAYACS
jgi:WD40 repeat protein